MANSNTALKIATWNVNSLKVRLPQVMQRFANTECDVLCLQETKMTDEVFPFKELQQQGWHVSFSGQKTYNGVAIIARQKITDVVTDVMGLDDPQRRIMAATIGDVRILNLYVVNGSEVGSDKYAYKLHWLNCVSDFIKQQAELYKDFVVVGDFNIAPADSDVHDPKKWKDKILCSDAERQALNTILSHGFSDVFRKFEQPEHSFTWWDYRTGGFEQNVGLRIDLILPSQSMTERCDACYVDVEPRQAERPSDHAPVVASFN